MTAAPDPELVRTVVEAVRGGASLREVAEQAGVSHMTVRRWVARGGGKTGRPPTIDAEGKAHVKRRKAQGASNAQIARELRVSDDAVDRVTAAPFAGTGPVTPPPPPDAPLTAAELARDPLERAKERLARLDREIDREFDAGNRETALALQRQANELLDVVRKIEESRRSDGTDVVTFTREQLERGARIVRERLEALAADASAHGGLTCVRCGEALRLAAAQSVQGGKA